MLQPQDRIMDAHRIIDDGATLSATLDNSMGDNTHASDSGHETLSHS